MKHSGIYHIQIGPWFYYGQSVNLSKRKRSHLCLLSSNKHPNVILQRAYDKYQSFEFNIIGEVPSEELDGAEQFFIDCFHGMEHCANIAKDAIATRKGIPMSEEHKNILKEFNTGRKHSKEELEKMSISAKANPAGACHPKKMVTIDGTIYESIIEASRQLGIARATIRNRIKQGVYTYVKP